jgi:hypothetical protein
MVFEFGTQFWLEQIDYLRRIHRLQRLARSFLFHDFLAMQGQHSTVCSQQQYAPITILALHLGSDTLLLSSG